MCSVLLVYLEKRFNIKGLGFSNKVFTGDSVDLIKTNRPSCFLENFTKGIQWDLCHLEEVISPTEVDSFSLKKYRIT